MDPKKRLEIRPAQENDVPSLLAIYSPSIVNSPISFETEIPSVNEFTERLQKILQKTPWIVAEIDGVIAGYAYASEHRSRKAYQWSVETSVFLSPDFQRMGIGKTLYQTLFRILKKQGYLNAYGGITLPNAASVALHESVGFQPFCVYQKVGFKAGAWWDVGWWHKVLNEYTVPPPNLISFHELGPLDSLIQKV